MSYSFWFSVKVKKHESKTKVSFLFARCDSLIFEDQLNSTLMHGGNEAPQQCSQRKLETHPEGKNRC